MPLMAKGDIRVVRVSLKFVSLSLSFFLSFRIIASMRMRFRCEFVFDAEAGEWIEIVMSFRYQFCSQPVFNGDGSI